MKIGTEILATLDDGSHVKMHVKSRLEDGTFVARPCTPISIAVIDPDTKTITGKHVCYSFVSYKEFEPQEQEQAQKEKRSWNLLEWLFPTWYQENAKP